MSEVKSPQNPDQFNCILSVAIKRDIKALKAKLKLKSQGAVVARAIRQLKVASKA